MATEIITADIPSDISFYTRKEDPWHANKARGKKREKMNRFCGACMSRQCCDGLVRGKKAYKRSKNILNADKRRYFDTVDWNIAAHPYCLVQPDYEPLD